MTYWDWNLVKDSKLLGELVKLSQEQNLPQVGSTENITIASRLASILKQQMLEPGKDIQLPDNTNVDMLPQILDPKKWQTKGSIILTLGDLKSADTLRQWFNENRIATQANNEQPSTIDGMNFDQCAAIQFIYERAQYYSTHSTPESKVRSALYLKQIKQIASEANCNLTQSSGQNNHSEPGTNAGTNMSGDVIAKLTELRPFNSQYINFAEIIDFVDTYALYANNAEVSQTAATIKEYISEFKSLLGVPRDTLQLFNLTTDQFKAWLKNGNAATIAINGLYDIIEYAGSLYQQMAIELQKVATDKRLHIDYRSMQQQVVPGGPQTTNISTINTLKYNLDMKAGH